MTLALVPPEPEDDFSGLPPEPDPAQQVRDAMAFLGEVGSGKALSLPWADLSGVVGPLLPGWLVVVGGRGKGGKTTFLHNLLSAWVEFGKRVLYVGTEQPAAIMRILWACQRTGRPVETTIDRYVRGETDPAVEADLREQKAEPLATQAIFGDAPNGTVDELRFWCAYAKETRRDVFIFDHLHRLNTGDGDNAWTAFGGAVRDIKNMARDHGLLVVTAAQLKAGATGYLLGDHEAPGNSSWYGGLRIQQEADLALQVWRPLRKGVTEQEKREAKDDGAVKALVQQNVMAVRVAASRYRASANGEVRRLCVRDGRLESFSARVP